MTIPVPLIDIAKALGYGVFTFKLNDNNQYTSGAVYYDDKKIFVHPTEPLQRRNFTLAHELGHIWLGHDEYGDRLVDKRENIESYNTGKSKTEYDADQFAAELLMPAEDFISYWKFYKNVAILADTFDVSGVAVSIRINNLKGLLHDR